MYTVMRMFESQSLIILCLMDMEFSCLCDMMCELLCWLCCKKPHIHLGMNIMGVFSLYDYCYSSLNCDGSIKFKAFP